MAIRSLISSSVLRRKVSNEAGDPSRYDLGAFAQQFLIAVDSPNREFVASVQSIMKRMRVSKEVSEKFSQYYRYDQFAIHCHRPDERLVGVRLRQSLELSRNGQYDDAVKLADSAEKVLPQFSETRRIKAMIFRDAGDLVMAKEEFEACLELDPNSRIGRYAFGLFLTYDLEDFDAALGIVQLLVDEDPEELPPTSLLALILQRSGRLLESAKLYDALLERLESARPRVRLAILDQAAETYRRRAELDGRSRERSSFRKNILRAIEIMAISLQGDGAAEGRTKARLERIVDDALREAVRNRDGVLANEIAVGLEHAADALPSRLDISVSGDDLLSLCNSSACTALAARLSATPCSRKNSESQTSESKQRKRGSLIRLVSTGAYGFLVDNEEHEWFFHRNHLRDPSLWSRLEIGMIFDFGIGENLRGPCAVDLRAT